MPAQFIKNKTPASAYHSLAEIERDYGDLQALDEYKTSQMPRKT